MNYKKACKCRRQDHLLSLHMRSTFEPFVGLDVGHVTNVVNVACMHWRLRCRSFGVSRGRRKRRRREVSSGVLGVLRELRRVLRYASAKRVGRHRILDRNKTEFWKIVVSNGSCPRVLLRGTRVKCDPPLDLEDENGLDELDHLTALLLTNTRYYGVTRFQ